MDRRTFLKLGATFAGISLGGSAYGTNRMVEPEDIKKTAKINVIYHADFPQESRFKTMLRNISNHLYVYHYDPFKLKIVVIAHGEGAKFFLKDLKGTKWEKENIDQKAIKLKLEELLDYGVEFFLCGITVRRARLQGKVYEFVKLIPSGVGAIAYLQSIGFSYIKVQ